MTIAYIPRVFCAKCSKWLEYGVELKRQARGTKRVLVASHHGVSEELTFATEPDIKLTLWQS